MTIKEIEALSGMERANIRFYEREGLIAPERMENGYRNYSDDELEILLRIKLLRSLHISLDEIKALQEGSKNLADTLSKQIFELEKERQGVSYAQDVCRAMQEDGVSFNDLDAKKYLEGISRITGEIGSSYFDFKGDELPQVFYPWRRFLARILDLSIYSTLWSIILILVFHVNLATRSSIENIFNTIISLVIMLFLEPLWLHLSGTTPGKAIFGLRIEDSEGRRLRYLEGFERTWGVLSSGMGYNFPIYNLVRLWKSYKLCSENETLPWDEGISYTIKDTKGYRGVILVCAYAVIFAVLAMAISAQQLPPNRDNLIIAEFVENYNYYAKFFDISFGNEYLDENGRWVEKDFDGTAYIDISNTIKPEYNFTIENGYVIGVSFVIELKNKQDWIGSYDNQMVLASLSFAGAQDGIGLFSKTPSRIIEQINQNTFGNFDFIEAGIRFACQTTHSGYIDTPDMLIPDENVEENYSKLEFSMNKLK